METQVCKKCGRELPVDNFKKTRWGGYAHVCKECALKAYAENKKAREEAEKTQGLSAYTPRQLMEELARRGYEGKLTFTRVETIDITNF